MDCSTPGFPVHHQHSELTQTHVNQVDGANQPLHPLLSPLPHAFILSQHRVFLNESVLHIRWPKYWNFSFIISPSNEYSGLISCRIDWLTSLQSKGLSRVFSNTTVQMHQFFGAFSPIYIKNLSLWYRLWADNVRNNKFSIFEEIPQLTRRIMKWNFSKIFQKSYWEIGRSL